MNETKPKAILIEGRGPLLVGLRAVLAPGESVQFGRSRKCKLSLRRAPAFAAARDPVELLGSHEFNRISRVHCEILHHKDGRIEVKDLSDNGTWVRGVRVKDSVAVMIDGKPIEIAPVDGDLGTFVVRRSN